MNKPSLQIVQLTREELYEEVWKRPLQQLAKDLWMSDVGLAKICRKNQIVEREEPPILKTKLKLGSF
ncbi:MAG: hypothetical protein ABI597_08705 [Gammaproteobacteria bacterium]